MNVPSSPASAGNDDRSAANPDQLKKGPTPGSPEWGFKFLGGWPKAWALSFIFRRRASRTRQSKSSYECDCSKFRLRRLRARVDGVGGYSQEIGFK